MSLVIALLFVAGIGLVVWAVVEKNVGPARVKLTDANQGTKIRRGARLSRLFPFSGKLLEALKLNTKLQAKLDAGHVKLAPAAYFNIKLLVIILLVLLSFFILRKLEPLVVIVCVGLGYLVPDIILRRKIAQRKDAIARVLPETVDLLGLCVEAGLDFSTAVKWVIEKTKKNPMLEELAFVLEEIKWGKPRSQALKEMSKRINVPEVSSFVQTLVLAERMGTPVAEAFTILSEDTRLQRFHRGERFAMQAPIKILLPLIFFILPVIGIIIGGPILLQFMQGKLF